MQRNLGAYSSAARRRSRAKTGTDGAYAARGSGHVIFRRFLHTPTPAAEANDDAGATAPPDDGDRQRIHETDTVRRIVARLESLPADRARLLASMAYVLARAAYADLEVSDVETTAMERILVSDAGIDEAQAVLVVEMAKLQARTYGQTEDYLVTREFRESSTPEQRLAVLRACFAVGAADDAISGAESATLNEIANELDVDRDALGRLRAEYADAFVARRLIPQQPA
jgi:uncharacterized tellurite resistance protein B-like protein